MCVVQRGTGESLYYYIAIVSVVLSKSGLIENSGTHMERRTAHTKGERDERDHP